MDTYSKTYSDMLKMESFFERLNYLVIGQIVGVAIHGRDSDRNVLQSFYKSREWLDIRGFVINRDYGCDLGIKNNPIVGIPLVHHINPITRSTVINHINMALDPENLITTSDTTHRMIHYGIPEEIKVLGPESFVQRTKGDTIPWQRS